MSSLGAFGVSSVLRPLNIKSKISLGLLPSCVSMATEENHRFSKCAMVSHVKTGMCLSWTCSVSSVRTNSTSLDV